MDTNKPSTIYIISGPCGVGKSTTSRELVLSLNNTVLIEGDTVHAMFMEKDEPSWEKRLAITWQNILALTRIFIQHNLDVVIDYVVEEELEWFCRELSDLHILIKYVVLRANGGVLTERITKRGDIDLIERSLFLLGKLESHPLNERHLYDITDRQTSEIVNHIICSPDFFISRAEFSAPSDKT